MGKRLARSNNNRVISGVCGGIAEYFSTDATIIRLVCAAFALTGTGIIVYFIAAIIMPERDKSSSNFDEYDPEKDFKDYTVGTEKESECCKPGNQSARTILGVVLICFGALFFAQRIFDWIDFKYLFPLVFVVIGVLIIFKNGRKNT